MQVSDFQRIGPFGRRGKRPPDHQHVSSSPSKIPYGGFSPVRLQTGRPRQPSGASPSLSASSAYARFRLPYMPRKSCPPPRDHVAECSLRSAQLFRCGPSAGQAALRLGTGRASPEALGSPAGYVVPQCHRLLCPHLRLCPPTTGLSSSSRWPLGGRLRPSSADRGSPLSSACLFLPCHLLYPDEPRDCIRLLLHRGQWPSPHRHGFGTRSCARSGLNAHGVTRLSKDRLTLRPGRLLALLRQGRLRSSFRLRGRPQRGVEYDYIGTQPTPMARLSLARHAAPWAARR